MPAHSAFIADAHPNAHLPATPEPTMNREFQPTSKRTRLAAILVAVLCTVLVGSGIDGLAGHFYGQAIEQATSGHITLAQR